MRVLFVLRFKIVLHILVFVGFVFLWMRFLIEGKVVNDNANILKWAQPNDTFIYTIELMCCAFKIIHICYCKYYRKTKTKNCSMCVWIWHKTMLINERYITISNTYWILLVYNIQHLKPIFGSSVKIINKYNQFWVFFFFFVGFGYMYVCDWSHKYLIHNNSIFFILFCLKTPVNIFLLYMRNSYFSFDSFLQRCFFLSLNSLLVLFCSLILSRWSIGPHVFGWNATYGSSGARCISKARHKCNHWHWNDFLKWNHINRIDGRLNVCIAYVFLFSVLYYSFIFLFFFIFCWSKCLIEAHLRQHLRHSDFVISKNSIYI